MRIILYTGSFGGGGAERRIVLLANYFIQKNHKVLILCYSNTGSYLASLDKNVSIKKIFAMPVLRTLFRTIHATALQINYQPNLIFSNLYGVNKIAIFSSILSLMKNKLIISVVNNPIAYSHHPFIKYLYSIPKLIIANSEGLSNAIVNEWGIDCSKIQCIKNGLDIDMIQEKSDEPALEFSEMNPNKFPVLCAVGSLSVQKGYVTLLLAMKEVLLYTDVLLIIIGEGPLRENLVKLIDELDIKDNVMMLGYRNNPYKYVKNSDIFVHAATHEGFPNVLLESMICKTPIVSTNCNYGPGEIIQHSNNGYLVEVGNSGQLAKMILMALSSEGNLLKITSIAYQDAIAKYQQSDMLKKYEQIFLDWIS